jgi:hypothetical protein
MGHSYYTVIYAGQLCALLSVVLPMLIWHMIVSSYFLAFSIICIVSNHDWLSTNLFSYSALNNEIDIVGWRTSSIRRQYELPRVNQDCSYVIKKQKNLIMFCH